MKQNRNLIVTAGFFAAAALGSFVVSSAHAATAYDGNIGFVDPTSTITHYAQQVTLEGGPVSHTISGFTFFGMDWTNIAAGTQDLQFTFWTGADLSPTSANALSGATSYGTQTAVLAPPGSNGDVAYSLAITPVVIPSDTFTLEVSIIDPTTETYSTALQGLFSQGALSVGSDTGYVWMDSGLTGSFTGLDQNPIIGGGSPSHIVETIDATPVPEPVTSSMLLGIAGLSLMRRRSRG